MLLLSDCILNILFSKNLMHISKLSLVNYRNFANAKFIFNKGINTVIGENSSGKTNLFRAIRLLLDDDLPRSAHRLEEKDFYRGLGRWQGHWVIISMEFDEISQDEAVQALFLQSAGNVENETICKATYNLIFRPKLAVRNQLCQLNSGDVSGLNKILDSITIEDYETTFTGRSEANFNDEKFYQEIVGDFEQVLFKKEPDLPTIGTKIPYILSITEEISFTFIQAMRDVVADFQNNRTNPLLTLLKSKSDEINTEEFEQISQSVCEINNNIEILQDVQNMKIGITDTVKEAAGETYSPSSLSVKSALPNDPYKLFQSLKLFVGEEELNYEGDINELSLGGANLIYITLKLLKFKYQKANQSFANFLLIEEPESHIHTHIQKTLFERLNYSDTQIIYSTHSTHISAVSNVQNINILGRRAGRCESYQPSTGLLPDEINNIQRYLDAVRSNLLFAKSVILVEGDAEEILIPILVKQVFGLSLDEMGISLINIGSTGFQNIAILFHDERIKKKCSIITDLDASIVNTTPNATDSKKERKFKKQSRGSQISGMRRKSSLDEFVKDNTWMDVFYAPNN
jgi:putative ATP-dependent endonuclease of the OLD family